MGGFLKQRPKEQLIEQERFMVEFGLYATPTQFAANDPVVSG